MTTTSDQALTRDEALRILRDHKAELVERFAVREIALFGSTVRNEAGPDSDVDILVSFKPQPGWEAYFGIHSFLEDLLGRRVDLVDQQHIVDGLRPYIEREALDVFHPPENWRLPLAVPKRWDIYVDDMLNCCRDVLEFTHGLAPEDVRENKEKYLATLHQLQTVGEAANKVPAEIRQAHPEIPWTDMVDARNWIAHGYDAIRFEEIWMMITQSVPALILQLEALRLEAEPEPLPDA